mgnify:CR=1 FL=1
MSKLPYPGFNPSFKNVKKRNGLHRNVFVLEILSKKPISAATRALISEQTEAKIDQLLGKNGLVDFDVVSDDRFDVLLQQGLRFTAEGY